MVTTRTSYKICYFSLNFDRKSTYLCGEGRIRFCSQTPVENFEVRVVKGTCFLQNNSQRHGLKNGEKNLNRSNLFNFLASNPKPLVSLIFASISNNRYYAL